MKTKILILCFISLSLTLHPFAISHAQKQRPRGGTIKEEANQVWKGEYSPGDLAKWGKRLRKFRASQRWGGVSWCHNAIGVIHFYERNFDEALRHLNQSLQIWKLGVTHDIETYLKDKYSKILFTEEWEVGAKPTPQ